MSIIQELISRNDNSLGTINEDVSTIMSRIVALHNDISDFVNESLRISLLGPGVSARFSIKTFGPAFKQLEKTIRALIIKNKVPTTIENVVFKIKGGTEIPSSRFVPKRKISLLSPFGSIENLIRRHTLYITLPYKMRIYMDTSSVISIIGALPKEIIKAIIHSCIEATAVKYLNNRSLLVANTPTGFFFKQPFSDFYGTYIVLRSCEGDVSPSEFSSTFNELLGYVHSMKRVNKNSFLDMIKKRKKSREVADSDVEESRLSLVEAKAKDPDSDDDEDTSAVIAAIKKILDRDKKPSPEQQKPKQSDSEGDSEKIVGSAVRGKYVIISAITDMISRKSNTNILVPTPDEDLYIAELKQMLTLVVDKSKNNEKVREQFADWIIDVVNSYKGFYPKYTNMISEA